jgi:low affinity Fe/Cu permease
MSAAGRAAKEVGVTTRVKSTRQKLHDPATMPTDITGRLSAFDKFATHADNFASRAWFFAFCVVLVVVWAPSFFLFGSVDTWQLIINTVTTIVTFLLVALLQNTQKRADDAVQHKLNAIADGLGNLMEHLAGEDDAKLRRNCRELRAAVGLEDREGA